MVTHADVPWMIKFSDLEALRALSLRHPLMRWTHLFDPVAFLPRIETTSNTPLLKEILDYFYEVREAYAAEIGAHVHMYSTTAKAAQVAFRNSPDINSFPPCTSIDVIGYQVPLTAYTEEEIRKILELTIDLFIAHGLGHPKSFCPGFYAANPTLQSVLDRMGFMVSAAAFPHGTTYGKEFNPCWKLLSGWDDSINHLTRPYPISTSTILPGAPPYLSLLEIPQTCKIDWMVSAQDMKNIFREHYALAQAGEPMAICFALHIDNACAEFAKFNEVLTFVDSYMLAKGVSVRYATLSEVKSYFYPFRMKY
jgi:hypothetical protein